MKGRIARLIGAGVGVAAMAATVAGAAGASTVTHHKAHGTLPPGIGIITFATGSAALGGCPFPTTALLVPTFGNAHAHTSFNKNGAWFTETVTANAVLIGATTAVVATGHETFWDGGELNQLFVPGKTTVVTHFTLNFTGTMTTGAPLNIHGNGAKTTIDATVKLVPTTKNPTTTKLTFKTTHGTVTEQHFNALCSA